MKLRNMTTAELEGTARRALKKDLFFLRMQHATNQLDNPGKIADCQEGYCPQSKLLLREKELRPRSEEVSTYE